MPTEPYDPHPYDPDGERARRFGAVTDMFYFNKAEPTEIGGQGEYIAWSRLTDAERERIEEHRNIVDNGFDYGAHG